MEIIHAVCCVMGRYLRTVLITVPVLSERVTPLHVCAPHFTRMWRYSFIFADIS